MVKIIKKSELHKNLKNIKISVPKSLKKDDAGKKNSDNKKEEKIEEENLKAEDKRENTFHETILEQTGEFRAPVLLENNLDSSRNLEGNISSVSVNSDIPPREIDTTGVNYVPQTNTGDYTSRSSYVNDNNYSPNQEQFLPITRDRELFDRTLSFDSSQAVRRSSTWMQSEIRISKEQGQKYEQRETPKLEGEEQRLPFENKTKNRNKF